MCDGFFSNLIKDNRFETICKVENEPSLLGIGTHIMVVAHKN